MLLDLSAKLSHGNDALRTELCELRKLSVRTARLLPTSSKLAILPILNGKIATLESNGYRNPGQSYQ
jgi:hypothetical protein